MPDSQLHTFAVGDVHGRADLLDELLWGIKCKATVEAFAYRVIFLGDIIDRGPASFQAMELVVNTLNSIPGSKLIRGNHDSFPLRILDAEDSTMESKFCGHWARVGGLDTLRSYGYYGSEITAAAIRNSFCAEHIACLRSADRYVELDHHILVHAGIVPGVSLKDQEDYDLMWIRDGFLTHSGSFGKVVVHGHTITESGKVEIFDNRIAVDTGAYRTGSLSAIEISPEGDVTVFHAYESDEPGGFSFRQVANQDCYPLLMA